MPHHGYPAFFPALGNRDTSQMIWGVPPWLLPCCLAPWNISASREGFGFLFLREPSASARVTLQVHPHSIFSSASALTSEGSSSVGSSSAKRFRERGRERNVTPGLPGSPHKAWFAGRSGAWDEGPCRSPGVCFHPWKSLLKNLDLLPSQLFVESLWWIIRTPRVELLVSAWRSRVAPGAAPDSSSGSFFHQIPPFPGLSPAPNLL